MTERLYYTDSYLRGFTARITGCADDRRTVYLDRTAFYPTSGGQPFDTGSIAGVAVLDVVDEDQRIAHKLAGVLEAAAVEAATGERHHRISKAAPWRLALLWTLARFLTPSGAPIRWSSRIALKAEEWGRFEVRPIDVLPVRCDSVVQRRADQEVDGRPARR